MLKKNYNYSDRLEAQVRSLGSSSCVGILNYLYAKQLIDDWKQQKFYKDASVDIKM